MKIDVEGAEVGVLQGAREIIELCKPKIFLSVHPTQLRDLGTSVMELRTLIDNMGYMCEDSTGATAHELTSAEYLLRPRE
jgi:hypothetical protein